MLHHFQCFIVMPEASSGVTSRDGGAWRTRVKRPSIRIFHKLTKITAVDYGLQDTFLLWIKDLSK